MSPKERFIARIKRNEAKFSPSDQNIAHYLVDSYPFGMLETSVAMAEKLGVSVATITRFFPKIEFKSIRQAQDTLRMHLDFLKNSPLDRYHQRDEGAATGDDIFDKAWNLDISNVQQTFQGISTEQIESFVNLVSDNRAAIYIIGERKTFALSFYMYVQLHALHPNAIHVKTDQSLIADTIVNVKPNDILIVFDFRRYPKVNIKLAEVFRDIGGKIIVITDSALSPSTNLADVLFIVESKGISIFDSYTAGFTLINSLLAKVTQCSGDYVRERYETLEKYYSQFEIFSSQQLGSNISRLPAQKEPENKRHS